MFDWLKSDSSRNHFGFRSRSRSADSRPGSRAKSQAAGEDSFRFISNARPPDSNWVSLDRSVDLALCAHAQWLTRRGVATHFYPGEVFVKSDAAGVQRIAHELIAWAAGRAPEIAITSGGAGPGSPNLLIRARLSSPQDGPAPHTGSGHEGLLRQLRLRDVRVFFTSEPGSLCFGVEFAGGTARGAMLAARDCSKASAATVSPLAGRRLAILTQNETLRSCIRNLTRGLGLSVRPFASGARALQDAAKYRPHALIYDSSLDASAMQSLRRDLTGDNATSFIAVHDAATDFHITQLGGLSTAHAGLNGLEQALMFTLCKP